MRGSKRADGQKVFLLSPRLGVGYADWRNAKWHNASDQNRGTGKVLALRLDQGVSYWRVSSWSKGGTKGTWFDLANPNAATQAKAVASMDVWVEGQVAPTQVFAKL